MKAKLQALWVTFLLLSQLAAQVTVEISYYQNKAIEPDLWGFHMSNFFESCACYDPEDTSPGPDVDIDLCMQIAANLKPRVLRLPAGGEHRFMHLTDANGYGRRYSDIDEMEAIGWILPASADDEYLKVDYQNEYYEDIPFLERMVDFVEFCAEENGYAPEVIFVANIILTKLDGLYSPGEMESENLAAIRYLLDQGVKIVGIEMGNEHYDDRKEVNDKPIFNNPLNPNELYFNSYYQACLPLLDSLDSDPALSSIPISLVAAPEPFHGEAIGHFGSATASSYKAWNTALKDSAQSLTAGDLFDAYTVHLYNVPSEMPWCYNMYYEDYAALNPDDEIEVGVNDEAIVAAWECADDSFRVYTQDTLKAILNNWAGSCTDCLGNDKPYWMTEWGRFGVDGVKTFSSGGTNYSYSGDFANTFIDGAFAFQFMLEMTDYEAGVGAGSLADVNFLIKHNYLSKSLGGTISEPLQLDDDPPSFYRRAKYWPFILTQDIYHRNYERILTNTVPLDGETRMPFIKCFYYDNPWSIDLPNSFCIEIPSGFTSPVFYMYYYNPYPDDITFKHEEMTGWEDDPEHTFNPTSDNAAFMKYVEVDQLYEHGGTNKWMMDNSFYSGGQPQDITGISQQVVDLCNGDSIVLKGYSYGYVYWGITPEPFRMAQTQDNGTLKVFPVPASEQLSVYYPFTDVQESFTYRIISIFGMVLQGGVFPDDGYLQVQRNNAAMGVYLIQLIGKDGSIEEEIKFIWE